MRTRDLIDQPAFPCVPRDDLPRLPEPSRFFRLAASIVRVAQRVDRSATRGVAARKHRLAAQLQIARSTRSPDPRHAIDRTSRCGKGGGLGKRRFAGDKLRPRGDARTIRTGHDETATMTPTDPPPITRSMLAPLLRPLRAMLAAESAGGVLLLASALVAIAWANSPWAGSYLAIWHARVSVDVAGFAGAMSLEHVVNDALMAVFFLLVGLEMKRELLLGELASVRRATLPVVAAIGGMVVPALIYVLINRGGPGVGGWGVPMATDIAFAVGAIALVGRALPASASVFLLAVAIVDDLGAVLVIAVFYTSEISLPALSVAGGCLAVLVAMNAMRVHRVWPYLIVGVGLWAATFASGIHATLAGVLLAFTIPATRQIEELPFVDYVRQMLGIFARDAARVPYRITEDQSHALNAIERAAQAVQTPLARVEHALLRPVNFAIVPLFALANAGVDLRSGGAGAFRDPVAWGVIFGLLVGKPIGIFAASWASVRAGLATLPSGATWRQIFGLSVLCGIGFTMSLFIANLAFAGSVQHLAAAKLGILIASIVAGVVGGWLVRRATV